MFPFPSRVSSGSGRIRSRRVLSVTAMAGLLLLGGCGDSRSLAPVTGRVLYNGKPLTSGTVFFQPEAGQPATGEIQPDGAFTLRTRGEGDGAVVGRNKVRVTCYETPAGGAAEQGEAVLGRLLIPKRYTDYETSGLVVEVPPDPEKPIEITLTD